MNRIRKFGMLALLCALPTVVMAGERKFGYVYDTEVLPEGAVELEQSITNQNGQKDGDYSRWDIRPEFEYGISESLQTALYLNLVSERFEGVSGEEDGSDTDFKGVSSEWIYQLVNPITNPVGVALYAEYTTDGIDQELESKLLFSKDIGNWSFAFNTIYELESEKEGDEREKEGTLEFTAGVARKIANGWTAGIEARQKSAYPGGYDLDGQEFQAVSVGPVAHYAGPKFWTTLTVLPQVWGNGEGAQGGRQLVHEEKMEVRFLIGTSF